MLLSVLLLLCVSLTDETDFQAGIIIGYESNRQSSESRATVPTGPVLRSSSYRYIVNHSDQVSHVSLNGARLCTGTFTCMQVRAGTLLLECRNLFM